MSFIMNCNRRTASSGVLTNMERLLLRPFRNYGRTYISRAESYDSYLQRLREISPAAVRESDMKGPKQKIKKASSIYAKNKSDNKYKESSFQPVKSSNNAAERRPLDSKNNNDLTEPQSDSHHTIELNGVSYQSIFLRDACDCHRCVDSSTRQKNFQTSDIPANVEAHVVNAKDNGDVEISWQNDIPRYGDDHSSTFSKKFLDTYSNMHKIHRSRYNYDFAHYWTAENISGMLQYVKYDDYMTTDEGLLLALNNLSRLGLLILREVPDSEISVANIAERIGNLRDTFYGRTWDVKSVPQAKNVAYTSQYLGLHMDLLYMTNPPGFQFLHCLKNTCSGGSSIFADAFHAASKLSSLAYRTMNQEHIAYHYLNAGEHYYHTHPLIETPSENVKGVRRSRRIAHVNYSPPFQAPFPYPDPKSDTTKVARGLREFASIVEDPKNRYEYKLQEGECVIFNNRRVLHGRKEFDTSGGERWLKGTYIDTDVFMSRYRVLNEKYRNRRLNQIIPRRFVCWDVENPETGMRETDPSKLENPIQNAVYTYHL